MIAHDGFAQKIGIQVGVNLSGEDRLVAEHLLYGAEIRAALNEVGSEGMAEGVRAYIFLDACLRGIFFYGSENADAAKLTAPAIEEDNVFCLGFDRNNGADVLKVNFQMANGFATDGDDAFFISFAGDADETLREV